MDYQTKMAFVQLFGILLFFLQGYCIGYIRAIKSVERKFKNEKNLK